MQTIAAQITDFLNKCEEMKTCKFIMAPTKIKDLLKAIVNCPELYELFKTVSSNFDYVEEKKKCFVKVSDGIVSKNYMVLPEKTGDRLAFIFCLLVEFDNDIINFNWFLQTYYSDDGSYYSSYHAFCDSVILSLEQIVSEVFASELASANIPSNNPVREQPTVGESVAETANAEVSSYLSAISLLVANEKQFILESAVPADDKEAGYKMLTEILKAVKEGDADLINALVCGYNYYVLYNNCISESISTLFETIQQYEEKL